MPKTVILIHGAWVTPACWDRFKSFLESRGYNVIAPAWPYKDRSIEDQRMSPDPNLAHLGIKEIVDHYDAIIRKETEPPILIGHSFGGLFVQMLLDRGLGVAGIAIDPAPPKGIFAFYPSVVWSLRKPLLTPFGWRRIITWPFEHFRYAFVHTLSPGEQRHAYDTYVVPESGRIFWQSAFAPITDTAKINFKNDQRAPLLIIAGAKDRIVPAAINKANYKKYKKSKAKIDFYEFPDRVHWIIAEPGWEQVATYCEEWLRNLV